LRTAFDAAAGQEYRSFTVARPQLLTDDGPDSVIDDLSFVGPLPTLRSPKDLPRRPRKLFLRLALQGARVPGRSS
jgi:hypothetical protein